MKTAMKRGKPEPMVYAERYIYYLRESKSFQALCKEKGVSIEDVISDLRGERKANNLLEYHKGDYCCFKP
mgnify:FL=1